MTKVEISADHFKPLLLADADELYDELGLRLKAIEHSARLAGSFELPAEAREETFGLKETAEDLRRIGELFFQRVNRDAYELVCGTGGGYADDRANLLKAFNIGPEAIAASLTALFIAYFGWAPLVATAVAALVVKLFGKNALGATCEVWKTKL